MQMAVQTTRTCETCQMRYVVPVQNLYLGQRPQRYCSKTCAGVGRRRPPQICQNPACGISFTPKTANGKYCSVSCCLLVVHANRKAPLEYVVCENAACSRKFVVPRGHNKSKYPRRFCANSCKWSALRARQWLCVACQEIVSQGYEKCRPCSNAERAVAVQEPRRCVDCGDSILEPRVRRCADCRHLLKFQNKTKQINRRYINIDVGRELLVMFPDLRSVVDRELSGCVGEQRRNRRKEALAKIGAEGAKMFKLK